MALHVPYQISIQNHIDTQGTHSVSMHTRSRPTILPRFSSAFRFELQHFTHNRDMQAWLVNWDPESGLIRKHRSLGSIAFCKNSKTRAFVTMPLQHYRITILSNNPEYHHLVDLPCGQGVYIHGFVFDLSNVYNHGLGLQFDESCFYHLIFR